MTSAAPRPTEMRTVAGGDITSKAIELPKPEYPPAARESGVTGRVEVSVLIDEKGKVVHATAISGHPLLRAAAEAAARAARFPPPAVDGSPVKISGTIAYDFQP